MTDTPADDPSAFADAVAAVAAGADPVRRARDLYGRLTDDERLGLLDGDTPFWKGIVPMGSGGYNTTPYVHGEVARLGIPGTRFVDGPRGCVAGHGTAFPVSMARGATWDIALEEQVGGVIGREIRAQGGNFFGGVCVNLLRHPAWGRAQETYGDDPHHLGEMGAALVRGSQRWVMACVKHYACNSMENARFRVDVAVDEATLHDVYLPHFRRVVDEGVAAVMASYNAVNGEWCGQHAGLLTEVLRDRWGFAGVTVTDFVWGMRDGATALEAGMDIEEPFAQQRATHLPDDLAEGRASWASVERSGVRILATQLRSSATRAPADPPPAVMADPEARALARRVAGRAMVLLKNEGVGPAPVLPLDPSAVASIALVGRLADQPNQGDQGSSNVRAPSVVTPRQGVAAAFPDARLVVVTTDDPGAAAEAAAGCDVAVVVVGYDAHDEGEFIGQEALSSPELMRLFPPLRDGDLEGVDLAGLNAGGTAAGGDRASLRLRPVDEELIAAVAAANPRTVVAVVAAGAVITEAWRGQVPALLIAWYAGMEGGHALADVLVGRVNPSGRLPFAVPTSEAHLPAFDRDAAAVTYDRYHGQRLLDRLGVDAAFPHGFGLSYTTFSIVDAGVVDRTDEGLTVRARVANTGSRAGHHVVQVYGRSRTGPYAGELLLAGFAVVAVAPGGTGSVDVPVSLVALAAWDPAARRRVVPALGDVGLEVGSFAHDPASVRLDPAAP